METGNRLAKGFTLLEVLGIIVLLGLVTTLVYPSLVTSQEKVRLQYIGKIVKNDLQLVQEEAVAERYEAMINFDCRGYKYSLGNRTITRSFQEHHFEFKLTLVEQDESAITAKPGIIKFSANGSCEQKSICWTTDHFSGNLTVQPDGTVGWNYEKKNGKK